MVVVFNVSLGILEPMCQKEEVLEIGATEEEERQETERPEIYSVHRAAVGHGRRESSGSQNLPGLLWDFLAVSFCYRYGKNV